MRAYFLGMLLLILLAYSCNRQTVRMDNFEVHGIDVSHYQSRINWSKVVDQDIQFAFVKASEGANFSDSLYCHNWTEMKSAGLRRGAYHFYRPTISPELQVANFASRVELSEGDLPPVLDVEVLDGVSKARLIAGITTWLYATEIKYGIRPIIYTNIKFYNKYLAGHFDEYPMWIARYNDREPRLACGRDWQFWQYGNRGRLNGIYGDVDFNVFRGTLADLDKLCLHPQPIISVK